MDATRPPWVTGAESAIRALRDVESATVMAEGDTIREIHVLTRSTRPAKQIVRDVQTVLQARFSRSIDYRVVSVAYLSPAAHAAHKPHAPPVTEAAPPPTAPAAPAVSGAATTPRNAEAASPVAPAPAMPPAPATPAAEERPVTERIRFGSVNLFTSGTRTQVQVELKWRGLPRMGSASGWSTRGGAHRIVSQATLAAVQEFLADELAISVQDVEFLRLGRSRVAVVSLSLLVGRQEKILSGTCAVEQDVHQAVALATLDALNRVVGGLRPREATEYILRSTPAQ